METLFNRLRNQKLREGETLVCFLGQAGVLIKTYPQRYVIVDPYLSDLCETRIGIKFKRLTPALLDADELDALQLEAYLLTHHHEDHLDAFLIPALRDKAFPFYAPPESAALLGELGVARDRILYLHDGAEHLLHNDIRIHGVFADHGEYAPDAVGIVIEIGGRTIFHMGDTCLDRTAFAAIRDKFRIDLLFVPINGRYGNMDAADGAEAVAILQPKQAVPCHFWMLPGNSGGDLELFLDKTVELAPQTNVRLMAAGESFQL
ncbi:MBL fold metallo-hydrolase [Paenibacillus cymbidii]|uniref:MBL fold metallo-hydrolase n=1 Tax=Paenibacillus cymbidii TaxID=1639034 RepID=UPI0010817657|nr:MBL fold metallo-hydrolase [Paenibacillus cymbidii]